MGESTEIKEQKGQGFISKVFRIGLPLLLGVVILYFLYRDTDFDEMWSMIKGANFGILLFSLVFGLAGNVIRGIRWKLLIDPLGYETKRIHLVYAALGSYAVNYVLPRAGEVWRCGIISKKEKVPFSKLLGTLIVDRLFDTIMVALIATLAFFLNAKEFIRNKEMFELPAILTSVWLYVGGLAFVLFIFAVLYFFRNTAPIKKINGYLISIWDVLKTSWRMKSKGLFLIYTVSIWICYFFFFYVTFYAFDFTENLGVTVGLFVFAVSSLSMSIPSNGGLCQWQAAVILSLGIFGVVTAQATAFATAVFTVQALWQALYGLFAITALSVMKDK